MAKEILLTLGISTALLLICVIAMAFKPLFIKGGKFSSQHIGHSKAMKKRGIDCVQTQDRKARQNINKNN